MSLTDPGVDGPKWLWRSPKRCVGAAHRAVEGVTSLALGTGRNG